MKFYVRGGRTGQRSARSGLLERCLRTHFVPRASNPDATDLQDATEGEPLAGLMGLNAFEPARKPGRGVFVGIAAAPEAMLGENTLVCCNSLPAELAALRTRFPELADAPLSWCRDVLKSFRRCVFLDPADFAESVGFSPWIEMRLVSQFLIRLDEAEEARGAEAAPSVQIFRHGPQAEEDVAALVEELEGLCPVEVFTHDGPAPEGRFSAADIHIHCGYTSRGRAAVLTPFDSLANGAYCILLGRAGEMGQDLQQALRPRSYAGVTETPEDALDMVESILDRIEGVRLSGMRFNPEIRRYDTMNHQFFEASFKRLNMQIDA